MKQAKATFPLRLPQPVGTEVEHGAKADGIDVNQFVAVAEKLAAMDTAAFFAERRARADFRAFERLMRRKDGELPGPTTRFPNADAARAE